MDLFAPVLTLHFSINRTIYLVNYCYNNKKVRLIMECAIKILPWLRLTTT